MQSTSKVVQWSDAYCIGLAEIDDQHKTLVDLINDLWVIIATKKDPEESARILERLEHYTIAHFSAEEIMMQVNGYPEFEKHQKLHKIFVDKLQGERAKQAKGEQVSLDMLHFLRDWLVNHILVNDKAYAAYFAEQKKPSGFFSRFFSSFRGA